METTLTKILFISILFSAAVPSILFSAEKYSKKIVMVQRKDTGKFERAPLLKAIESGKIDKVRKLLKGKVNVNDGETIKPLMMAASQNNFRLVELLIVAQANVNSKNSNETTALMFIVPQGNLEIARLLIGAQADPLIKDSDGCTVLQMATLQIADPEKKVAMLKLLGAKETTTMRSDNASIVLNYYDSYGDTAILSFMKNRRLADIPMLLESKADINASNMDGIRPLTLAASCGCPTAVRLLLKSKADTSCADVDGKRPLTIAVGLGHEEVVKLLLENKVDISYGGELPLKLAQTQGDSGIIKLLLDHMTGDRDAEQEE